MGSTTSTIVQLVHLAEDQAPVAALRERLVAAGYGVESRTVGQSSPDAGAAVVVWVTGRLLASGWPGDMLHGLPEQVLLVVEEGLPLDGWVLADRPRWEGDELRGAPGPAVVGVGTDSAVAFGKAWVHQHEGLEAADEAALPDELHAQTAEVGRILHGRFRLLERVANGPLAALWRAQDASDGAEVAVKVLHPQWLGSENARSFLASGRASQRALGDRLAQVRFVSEVGATPAILVRPWARATLADRVQRGELRFAAALQAVLDASEGLRALHGEQRIHGAVKPSNILLDGPFALLADPSGVRVSGGEASDVLYLAPESQEPGRRPDPSADLYALGMTALCALYGAPLPFWVLRDPERLLAELDIAEGVRDALRRALDWDPARRHGSVADFEDALLSDQKVVRELCDFASAHERHDVVAGYLGRLVREGEERSPSLLLALGRAELAAGDLEKARRSFDDASRTRNREDRLAAARGMADVRALEEGPEARVSELLQRAEQLEPIGVELLVDAARSQPRPAARPTWERVLEHHLDRRQAEEALAFLVEESRENEDWSTFFALGVQQHGFLPVAERAPLARELGEVAMDHLHDPPRALTWLQLAAQEGPASPGLVRRLEAIRSARGEWRQVVSLMLERAEGLEGDTHAVELMLRAARVALYAHNHHEDAASIMLRVLLRDPEHRHALRFLARYHARARRDERALALYARLAPHEERGREGEPLEVRVADNVDYARLLLRNDRPRGAQLCLEAALDLNPAHIPTLALTSQLSFDLGKWEEARVATRGLVAAYSSAEADATFCGALRRLGNLAWLHGDLIDASNHFNQVLELVPEDVESWWGRARIAFAANAGRIDADALAEMPWLTAAPVRLTPHEALARLLAGLLGRGAIERWMRLDPLGREMLALLGDQDDLVLVAGLVDLMVARQLVRGALFRRLLDARPDWEGPILAVQDLWFAPLSKQTFPIGEAYRWCAQAVDFDPGHHREAQRVSIDPEGPVDVRPSLSTLHHESAWMALLRWEGPLPQPPPVEAIEAGEALRPPPSAVLVLFPGAPSHGGSSARRVLRVGDGDVVGAAMDEVSLPLATLEPEHLRFEVVGDFVYVRALGPLLVDGERVGHRRLRGGERLRIGAIDARFHLYEEDVEGLQFSPRYDLDAKPANEDVFELDEAYATRPKAALFYDEGMHERMLPIVGDRIGVLEDASGNLTIERGSSDADVWVLQRQGGFFLREQDEGSRLLQHGDQFVVGARMVQFRLLDRLDEPTSLEEVSGIWGTPDDTPFLVFDDGSRHGRPIPLAKDVFTLGRGRDADFQIAIDASLSRVHCQLVREDGHVWIEDAGSSNGTSVNGVTLEGRVQLEPGDQILIGQTELMFSHPSATDIVRSSPTLHEYVTDDPTENLPVGEMARRGLPVDEGQEKVRIVNRVFEAIFRALDEQEGSGRGQAFLQNLVAARPRSYQGLLDGIDVQKGLPAMDVLYNLAQRPEAEQRPLLNHVLRDLIDRAIDGTADLLDDEAMDGVLAVLVESRYRDHLRF